MTSIFNTINGRSSCSISEGNTSSNSIQECVELRSRNKNNFSATVNDLWRQEYSGDGICNMATGGRMQMLEHVVKSEETLTQISLHYSIPVSEIKRVNNIVVDQEIYALPTIKIPLSRNFLLRRQLLKAETESQQSKMQMDEKNNQQQFDSDPMSSDSSFGIFFADNQMNDKKPLLCNEQDLCGSNDSLNSGGRSRRVIEGILNEADRNVAAVRRNLPSPTLDGGAFHFVDAGVPDTSTNIWLIVIIVVIIFVILPLGLTFLEETVKLEEHNIQKNHLGQG